MAISLRTRAGEMGYQLTKARVRSVGNYLEEFPGLGQSFCVGCFVWN